MSDRSRDHIVGLAPGSLGRTIYAGAGAGTGKTQALVERIANLIVREGVAPQGIAAITFTVAAASELRQRVRHELEVRRVESVESNSDVEQQALTLALDSLDSSFIGTIHSFAQSLLREMPLEVGLPPVFDVIDTVQSEVLFDEYWDEWLAGALEQPEISKALINAQRIGLEKPLGVFKDLAGELHANYDVVEAVGGQEIPRQAVKLPDYLRSIKTDLESAFELKDYCATDDDRMLAHLDNLAASAASVIDQALETGSEEEMVLALVDLPKLSSTRGQMGNWSPLPDGGSSLEKLRATLKAAQDRALSARQSLASVVVVTLVNAVAEMARSYADDRKAKGLLEFHDLLVLSCELLANNPEARRNFQSRFTHVLIDEFQDTDPLQLRLAKLLTARGESTRPSAGALFVVGDAKQSIYRFRRADLTQLNRLVDSLGAERRSLTENYRSHPEILEWVNSVFGSWMNGSDPNQVEYEPLGPGRKPSGKTGISRVMRMGGAVEGSVAAAREAEAADIARLAVDIGAGGWSLPDSDGGMRASTFRDLCVLLPRRTALPIIEAALTGQHVPYVLEGQVPIFESQVFKELSNNLAAIDDPTDQVAITAALKSGAWGCSDRDLLEWAKTGQRFEYARKRVSENDYEVGTEVRKVAAALAGIASFHDQRLERTSAYLIEKFIRERRIREIAALMDPTGGRERLIDVFVEKARALQRAGNGSLREFVRWYSRQAQANVRVAEGALATGELDAVRIMTVHAAKGLEFPVVVLAGLQTTASSHKGNVLFSESGDRPTISVKFGAKVLGLSTADYRATADANRAGDEAELVRVAYVGATRAREHLIVSVHRTGADKKSLASMFATYSDTCTGLWEPFRAFSNGLPDAGPVETGGPSGPGGLSTEARDKWKREFSQTISGASRRGYVTPSQLADHTMFEPAELAGPPPDPALPDAPGLRPAGLPLPVKPEDNAESSEWNAARRGRGGTDIGSAVHAVLQDVDLDDRANLTDLDGLARHAAEAYAIPGRAGEIARLARNVLESPTVARATTANSWREVWVAADIAADVNAGVNAGSAPAGGGELEIEGSIDLIICNDDGTFTIVDYKTDQVGGESLVERARGYERQLAGYVLAVERQGQTAGRGMEVRDAVLVFAGNGPGGTATEFPIPDLEAAKAAAIEKIRTLVG